MTLISHGALKKGDIISDVTPVFGVASDVPSWDKYEVTVLDNGQAQVVSTPKVPTVIKALRARDMSCPA